MKVIVTGPRNWGEKVSEVNVLHHYLFRLYWDFVHPQPEEVLLVIHGDARGADAIAREWAETGKRVGHRVDHKPYPAAWRDSSSPTYRKDKGYDPAAGSRRNRQMVDENPDTDIVLACRYWYKDWTPGTNDMKTYCESVRLPVQIVEPRS